MEMRGKQISRFWAGGFLYDQWLSAVCLHKRDSSTPSNPNKWAFFGGLNEDTETFVACFVRELREELGLAIEPADAILLRQYFNAERNSDRAVFYVRYSDSGHRLVLGEGAAFAWIKLAKVHEYDLTDKTRDDLQFFQRHLNLGRARHASERK